MKKILSVFLITAITLGLAAVGFAADSDAKITGMVQGLGYGYSDDGDDYVDLGEIYAMDEMVEYIGLNDTMFSWDKEKDNGEGEGNGDVATPTDLTASQIRAARMDVRVESRSSKVIDSVKINERESRVEVKFKDAYSGVKETDFEFTVYLTIDGRRQSDYGVTFTGTFGNPVIELYEGSDSVDLSDGSVALAMESIRELDADLGYGVTVTTRLTKDKRIYGSAKHSESRTDDDLRREYKDIAYAVVLNTSGFSTASTVSFGYEYAGMFVYGEDLTYLGKAGDDLPLYDKYYLASKKLDVPEDPGDIEPEPTQEPTEPTVPPMTTTPGRTPPNANNIPGTGW